MPFYLCLKTGLSLSVRYIKNRPMMLFYILTDWIATRIFLQVMELEASTLAEIPVSNFKW